MNTQLAERIIPRLSQDELRVMAMPTVQLAMLGGDKGITIERHAKVPAPTVKSLIARGLAKSNIDTKSRVMPLSGLGVQINEALTAPSDHKYAENWQLLIPHPDGRTWPCRHPRTEANTMSVGVDNGVRCRFCRRKISRKSGSRIRGEVA